MEFCFVLLQEFLVLMRNYALELLLATSGVSIRSGTSALRLLCVYSPKPNNNVLMLNVKKLSCSNVSVWSSKPSWSQ